jgi:phenylalanyl-tRNA synthetase beta chain
LNTEASYRFERSVDPEGVVRAIERFTDLLLESQPNVRVSNVIDLYPGKASRESIFLRLERANRLLGMDISRVDAIRYFESLGFDLDAHSEPIRVTPPSWRPDLEREIDLIEELGRVHGYEKIPEELPIGKTPVGGVHGDLHFLDRLRESLVRTGFVQIVSHSLRDSHLLDAPIPHVKPKNPASPEMGLLRNSLLPSLADAGVRNGGRDLHLFEIGAVFNATGDTPTERKMLGILSTGDLHPSGWQRNSTPNADFFSLKGALEAALDALSVKVRYDIATEVDARYHPTRLASVYIHGQAVGSMGQIHPTVAGELGLGPETYLAELDLAHLYGAAEIAYRPISRNPSVRRDISFEIDKAVPYARIDEAIASACGPELERHWLFDVYEGKGIGDGNHSLSVALQLRKMASNFTDEEANQVRERAVSALAALGAKPR